MTNVKDRPSDVKHPASAATLGGAFDLRNKTLEVAALAEALADTLGALPSAGEATFTADIEKTQALAVLLAREAQAAHRAADQLADPPPPNPAG